MQSKYTYYCITHQLWSLLIFIKCLLALKLTDGVLPAATRHVIMKRFINLLKPTGHVMHQQFNIQQLYVLPTLYLCVLYLSENKQRLGALTA